MRAHSIPEGEGFLERHRRPLIGTAIAAGGVLLMLLLARAIISGGSPAVALAPPLELESTEEGIVRAVETERRTLALTQLQAARRSGDQALKAVADLEAELQVWNEQVVPLLGNEQGRFLAGEPTFVKAFDTLFRAGRASRDDAQAARKRIDTLLKPIDQALRSEGVVYAPSHQVVPQLESDRDAAQAQAADYRQARESIQALLADARRAGKSAPTTLAEAIDGVKMDYAQRRATLIAAARDRVEEENSQKLVIIEEEKHRQIAEAERVRRESELEAQRLNVQAQTRQFVDRARLERIRALAGDPNVRDKYSAFLDPGHVVFMPNDLYFGKHRTERKVPASLSDLQRNGHLANAVAFGKAMCGIGPMSVNDRRTRADYPANEEAWKVYEELYREFRELAPEWVRMGMLRE